MFPPARFAKLALFPTINKLARVALGEPAETTMSTIAALDQTVLPAGIRWRFADGVNGLRMHVREAGYERAADTPERPCVRDIDKMRRGACTRMLGCHLVDGAGHWVQQERPAEVGTLLLQFLQQASRDRAS